MKRFSGIFAAPKTPFQVLSDLHLNHENQYASFHIPVTAPNLILAGNIGRLKDYDEYLSFLIRRVQLYERVYLVLGSLEFHGLAILHGIKLAKKLETEERLKGKIVLLFRKAFDVPDTNITLLGCTLWSQIPESAEEAVLKKIPEFDKQNGIQHWNTRTHNTAHKQDLDWLKTSLSQYRNSTSRQVLVITSFAPDLRASLSPWQIDSPRSSAYGSNLLNGNDWSGVKFWVHGSTGWNGSFKKNGVKVVSNQRGEGKGEEEKGLLRDGMSDKEKVGLFDIQKIIKV